MGLVDLQERVKWSIESSWKKSLSNDWLPPEKAKTFSLMKFYTDLEWVESVEGPLRSEQRKSNIFEMFKVKGSGKKPINILVKGNKRMYFQATIFVNSKRLKKQRYQSYILQYLFQQNRGWGRPALWHTWQLDGLQMF